MATDYKFEGWMGLDSTASEGNMVWQEFTPKKWEETDIDIKISHCGVCGSDLHTLRSGWVSLNGPKLKTQFMRNYQVRASILTILTREHPTTPAASATRSWAPPCA
jgi:hypothetical protein